jgi:hypothetical protein
MTSTYGYNLEDNITLHRVSVVFDDVDGIVKLLCIAEYLRSAIKIFRIEVILCSFRKFVGLLETGSSSTIVGALSYRG